MNPSLQRSAGRLGIATALLFFTVAGRPDTPPTSPARGAWRSAESLHPMNSLTHPAFSRSYSSMTLTPMSGASAGLPGSRPVLPTAFTSPSRTLSEVPSVQGIALNLPDFLAGNGVVPLRTFHTSFESAEDFRGFYIVPQNHLGTSSHDLSRESVHDGTYAHKGWIHGANPVIPGVNTNHRGYPTIQIYKTPGGAYQNHVFIEFMVWIDMKVEAVSGKNWVSLATLTPYADDLWPRTIQLNLGSNGFVALQHVPGQGQFAQDIYQPNAILFPKREWVKLSIYLDFTSTNQFNQCFAAVWQDDMLVSAARFNPRINPLTVPISQWPSCLRGWDGVSIIQAEQLCAANYVGGLAQAHFGLYAQPGIASGAVYNDDLTIEEVSVN